MDFCCLEGAPGTNHHLELQNDGVTDKWLAKESRWEASLESSQGRFMLTAFMGFWNPPKRAGAPSPKVRSAFG